MRTLCYNNNILHGVFSLIATGSQLIWFLFFLLMKFPPVICFRIIGLLSFEKSWLNIVSLNSNFSKYWECCLWKLLWSRVIFKKVILITIIEWESHCFLELRVQNGAAVVKVGHLSNLRYKPKESLRPTFFTIHGWESAPHRQMVEKFQPSQMIEKKSYCSTPSRMILIRKKKKKFIEVSKDHSSLKFSV